MAGKREGMVCHQCCFQGGKKRSYSCDCADHICIGGEWINSPVVFDEGQRVAFSAVLDD